jgi:hypothetical protein
MPGPPMPGPPMPADAGAADADMRYQVNGSDSDLLPKNAIKSIT